MTTTTAIEGVRAIPLGDIKVSTTGAQAERRAHFDKKAIAELAESIKTVGLLSPIIARPVNGHFELVAGERRYLAAQHAGLPVINVSVRDLTDEQVLEVQLVENLQREGLHELAEAEGYEALQELGHSAEEIADKVGKSKAYVYGRLKLTALSKSARKAFYEGALTASTALLLARIPVESVQKEALERITKRGYDGEPLSYQEAARVVRQEFMTNLSDGGFPTEDVNLVPAAGACGSCPKRTGNQPELFGDVKSKETCTDPACFREKRAAYAVRTLAEAQASGQKVIAGKDAKKVAPNGTRYGMQGFKTLDSVNYDDPKARTVAQIMGKGYQPTLLHDPETGKLVKVAPEVDVKAALRAAGVNGSSSSGSNPQAAAEKKAKLEKKFRVALYTEMRGKFPESLGAEDLRVIALRFFQEMQHEARKQILGLWQWEPVKTKGYSDEIRTAAEKGLKDLDDAGLARFLFDLVFIKDLQVGTWSTEKPTLLLNTAKKLKVDAEKIRKELTAASKPATAPKPAKKKAPRKPK